MADHKEITLDAELKQDFITEIKDDLEKLESDLLIMEQNRSETKSEVVNHAFRAIHSIKGGAGFCGLDELGSLSHAIENVLMVIREGEIKINPDIIDALLSGLDKIKLMVEYINTDETVSYENEKQRLEEIILNGDSYKNGDPYNKINTNELTTEDGGNADGSNSVNGVIGSFELNGSTVHVSLAQLKQASDQGKFLYGVKIDADKDLLKKHRNPLDMINDIKNSSDLLFTDIEPDLNGPKLKGKVFYAVLASILDTDFLAEVLEIDTEQIVSLNYDQFDSSTSNKKTKNEKIDSNKTNGDKTAGKKTQNKKTVPKNHFPESTGAEAVKNSPTPVKNFANKRAINLPDKNRSSENIRINTQLITKLMNLAGELVLTRNQLHPIMENYLKENKSDVLVMQNLDRVTSAIQEYIMQMRMQPVGKLFGRFKRIIRDTAKKLAKKVDYTMEGGDVELDRTIIEGLANPMIHLLRNCLDHGIESPEERIKAGKRETGSIRIAATHQGGHIYINIHDDGRGIDPEKIASHAVKKNIITKEAAQSMSDREKINIIFRPGFSTSDKITDISGRGVGMDVVKTNISELRGNIEIDSSPGQGTNIRINIPLTLAIISVLIVGTGNYRFAIPQSNISEIFFIPPGDMQKMVNKLGNSEIICLRNSLLPIVRLRNILDIDSFYTDPAGQKKHIERRTAIADRRNSNINIPKNKERRLWGQDRRNKKWDGNYIVVLKMGVHRFGLCVETLFDNEEIVVTPLSEYIKECRWFSGSTILGDGDIVMILDVSGVAKHANLEFDAVDNENKKIIMEKASRKKDTDENNNILIFSCSDKDEYYALPLDKLSRLDTICLHDIFQTGEYKFVNYKGSALSLFSLEELFSQDSAKHEKYNCECYDKKEMYVLIPKGLSFNAGIIIPCIIDTMQIPGRIKRDNNFPAGVVGTVLAGDKIIQFLDHDIICGLIEKKRFIHKNV